ncbi:type III-B CRISPR module RAMP protein Cmr6 [Desulfallas thermosapovorans]|uniref:CRISPR-associated Cmr6 family protein n=1 Tax=Desulfallas thermosapovorans DSM 6562 TaxID=1121431 RepID=A0A5S4ZPT5_9FIRM|nr:type III-B CRISPR module RAMP protein Cmr6 [Desulfallas thermosapovorans]TYO92772.1 CRISPR-associated Cmr6 family protein [Desulfallas thermosapovorans DSM 6562]
MLPDFKLPLYKTAHAIPENLPASGHAGLWYDKYCSQWTKDKNGSKLNFEKLDWIKTVTGQNAGMPELITEMKERLVRLAESRCGKVFFFNTGGRFVTGLGREHPVENGFTWHFLLGAPFLPGPSVKGVVRAWAETWLQEEQSVIDRIFGPEKKNTRRVGSVVFFDALPAAPVKLEAEVMTPHYMEYYKGQEPPADWHSPNPIPFLTVAAGQTFVFAIAPRRPENENDHADMERVAGWLENTLLNAGAGAKTASGYGRFIRDKRKEAVIRDEREKAARREEVQKRAAALAAMSPVRREMEEDGYSTDENKFMQQMTGKWLKQMESPDIVIETRQEIARLLADWYQKYRADQWKKPNKKNQDKINRINKVLQL